MSRPHSILHRTARRPDCEQGYGIGHRLEPREATGISGVNGDEHTMRELDVENPTLRIDTL